MGLKIHAAAVSAVTTIPNTFFDTYMPKANGDFVKVYLYLYRWQTQADSNLSISSIAATLKLTEDDVTRALQYWEAQSLIALIPSPDDKSIQELIMRSIPALSPSVNKQSHETKDRQPADSTEHSCAIAMPVPEKTTYTMNQITDFKMKNDGDQLFFVISQYLGRPLSHSDVNTIIYFYDTLQFSIDLIEYLFEYCASNGKRGIHYIEKVAISWAQKGIRTVSDAKSQNIVYSQANKMHYAVLKAYGIKGRAPTPAEIDYINRWHEDYCFPLNLIIEACNRTILNIHQPSFEYTDSILKNWKTKKVTNMDDIRILDNDHDAAQKAKAKQQKAAAQSSDTAKAETATENARRFGNRFGNFDQRVYNYSDLEQKLAQKIHEH